jgi:membrane protein DedA with SNARE-associated domain
MDQFSIALASLFASVLDAPGWIIDAIEWVYEGYRSIIREGAEAVRTLFEDYGYLAVFVGTLSENTILVGLIVPGSLVIILAGIAAHDGSISLPLAWLLGIGGTILGDTISYFVGRYGWSRLRFLRSMTEQVRDPILSRGTRFVLFYHFAGYTRVVGPAAAGVLRMPYRSWAPADYGGAALWVTAYSAIGYALGLAGITLDSTDEYFRYLEWILLGLVVLYGWHFYGMAQRALDEHQRDSEEREPLEAGARDK